MDDPYQGRYRKPAGSKIVLINNGTSLLIKIPTTRREIFIKSWSFVFILPLFQIYWLFIYKFQPYLISTYARVGSFFVLTIYSLSLMLPYLIIFLGKTIVEVEENKLLLKFIFFSSTLYKKEFSIGNIDRIGLSAPEGGGKAVCTVFSGTNTEYFGQYLSQIEQQWLVEEINYFLNQIRH